VIDASVLSTLMTVVLVVLTTCINTLVPLSVHCDVFVHVVILSKRDVSVLSTLLAVVLVVMQ
jgi:hypothetical protein